MIKYNDLKKIAESRHREAGILYSKGCYDGAVYLCGYVVEVALKARICKNLNLDEYPDDLFTVKDLFSTHKFQRLLLLSGLQSQMTLNKGRLPIYWSLLTNNWSPENRYLAIGTYSQQDARDILEALGHKKCGFFTWIKKQW